jgi:hypothetical protein
MCHLTTLQLLILCTYLELEKWVWCNSRVMLTGEKLSTGRNTGHSLCLPQIAYGMSWDRTQGFMVRGRGLTAWALAQPRLILERPSSTSSNFCQQKGLWTFKWKMWQLSSVPLITTDNTSIGPLLYRLSQSITSGVRVTSCHPLLSVHCMNRVRHLQRAAENKPCYWTACITNWDIDTPSAAS